MDLNYIERFKCEGYVNMMCSGYILLLAASYACAQFEYEETGGDPGFVYLDNNAYKGILMAVDSAVPFDPEIYKNVYDYMTATSQALSTATDLHISEVTLLLPQSWPIIDQCERVTSQIQSQASFLIGPDTAQWGASPHTIRLSSQCGTPGLVTVLPESFMRNVNVAKQFADDIGRTILHEWAHLRFGVFDESTEHMGGESCLWFDGGAMYPVKCSNAIQGSVWVSPHGNSCSFTPDENQPNHVSTSLMYKQYLNNIYTFCDKEGPPGQQHNNQVPNPQNDRCDGKSVWEVLRQHRDFSTSNLRPKRQAGVPQLTLKCVQATEVSRMVLTMDVSSSMKAQSRLLRMQQDVQVFLRSIPCRDTSMGLVEFSGTGTEKILHNLVSLTNEQNVLSLLNSVSKNVVNRTCIGCGIRKAIEVIRRSGFSTQGAVVVVFTDGLENDSPRVADVRNEVLNSGIVVYGILLLSQSTDHPLIQLSRITGGKTCVYTSDENQRATYYDCLESILHHRTPMSAPIQVMRSQISIPPNQHIVGTVDIDSSIMKNALVSVTWSDNNQRNCNNLQVSLISPNDLVLDANDRNLYDRNEHLHSITIDISNNQPGKWTYIMDNRGNNGQCRVRLLIEGRQKFMNCTEVSNDMPIVLEPYISTQNLNVDAGKSSTDNAIKLYVRLVQGSNPIIGAQVTAEIQDSGANKFWNLSLWDNGAGADYMSDDGVYSHYFIGYKNTLRRDTYSVKFTAKWQETTKYQMSTFAVGSAAPSKPQYAAKYRLSFSDVEPFRRASRPIFFSISYSDRMREYPLFTPAKITDLKVSVVDRWKMMIRLSWTAVGEQMDVGTASSYDIRFSTNAMKIREQFDQCQTVVPKITIKPKAAVEQETHVIHLEDGDFSNETTYYIAIKAVNKMAHAGPVSNVQLFVFKSTPNDSAVSSIQQWMWYIVALVLFVFLLFFLAVLLFIIIPRRRRHKKTDDTESSTSSSQSDDAGVSKKETSQGSNAPDILNEIQAAKSRLKKQNRYKEKEDGVFTISSKTAQSKKNTNKQKNISEKSQRKSIFTSIKKSTKSSSSKRRQKGKVKKPSHEPVPALWMAPDEPLQNHSYSNPLFGDSSLVPEVELINSTLDISKK